MRKLLLTARHFLFKQLFSVVNSMSNISIIGKYFLRPKMYLGGLVITAASVLVSACQNSQHDSQVDYEIVTCYDVSSPLPPPPPLSPLGSMSKVAIPVNEYIDKNKKYPQEAKKRNIRGTVVVQYTLSPNGDVQHAAVIQSVHPLLDSEAVRVVKSIPIEIFKDEQNKEDNWHSVGIDF